MNRYIAFLKVFERNSFSDAARDLGYTQSAVSQMIKSLEEELGVTLLVRSRSGVALTYEGRHLLPYIRDTVNAYRMLQSQAAGFSGLEQGTIRLGTFTSVSSYLLPPAMERFRRLHSGIRFELYQGLYYEIEDWVREGVVDFGFTDMLRTTPFPCEPIYPCSPCCLRGIRWVRTSSFRSTSSRLSPSSSWRRGAAAAASVTC
jgi:DNA-binding transcriptional LysR family regulator